MANRKIGGAPPRRPRPINPRDTAASTGLAVNLFRKIQVRKFSKIGLSSQVVCFGGFVGIRKIAKENQFSINSYAGSVFPSLFVPGYAFESSSVIALLAAVALILSLCAFPQVVSLIVQAVEILVVYLYFWISDAHNYAMHSHVFAIFPAPCVPSLFIIAFMRTPFPLVQPFIIRIVNQCGLSSCKLYFFHCFLKQNTSSFRGLARNKEVFGLYQRIAC